MTLPTARWRRLIADACRYASPVPEDVLEAMVLIESAGDPNARSVSDARGLTQIIPRWHADVLGQKVAADLGITLTDATWFDPRFSLFAGARLLKGHYGECGSWTGAVRKYHSGSCSPPAGFTDGGGTSSDQHITRYLAALQQIRADRAATSPQEEATMALTVKKQMIPATNRNYPHLLIDAAGDLWLIVHETGNTGPGTGAKMHADFLRNGGGSSSVAFHFAVDQVEAYQMLRLNRVGWHASDGCNSRTDDWGCFRGIAIETCVNDGNRYKDGTRRNLAELIVKILSGSPDIDYGGIDHRRFSVDRIRTHNDTALDKKWCPTYMLNDGYMPTLRMQVRVKLAGTTPAPVAGIAMGDTVEVTDALNVRSGWGLKHPITVTLMPGMRATVIVDGEGAFAKTYDGYTWLNIRGDFGTGWAAADWLQKVVIAPPPKPVEYAPRRIISELAALTVADRDTAVKMVLKNGIHFITVWDEVEATEDAVNLQFAYEGAKETEAPSPKGTRRWVSHLFQADDRRWYYYDERGNRLVADQWKRVADAPDIDALVATLSGTLAGAAA